MTTQIATIPSIKDRMYRHCRDCFFRDNLGCTAVVYGYKPTGERTEVANTYDISWSEKDEIPCRFHLFPHEVCQILDPYFME
jgi:hypothetical protein